MYAYVNSIIKTATFSAEYRDFDGKTWILPSVRMAEQELHDEQPIIADYLYPNSQLFTVLASQLILGEDNPVYKENRVSLF